MTDAELLEELERQSEEKGIVPFSEQEGSIVAKLSFTSRSLSREIFREAWSGFLAEIGLEALGWLVHFGVAVWYWEQEMRLHAASVFEHIHRDVRRGYDQIEEVAYYQAHYLPGMLQLYAELSDSERVKQLFGRLQELYEDGHISVSEYTDGLIVTAETTGEHGSADEHSLLRSATRTIRELRERLDTERREKEALKVEADAGVRFKDVCARSNRELRTRHDDLFATFYPLTQQFLVEDTVLASKPFRDIGPAWSPIMYQKAIEHEFNERVWIPFRKVITTLPSEFQSERLTINRIKRLITAHEPLVRALCEEVHRRLHLTLRLSSALKKTLQSLVDHSTRARHGDRKPYTVADLDECLEAISGGRAVLEIIAVFHPR
ncbi:MAG TPA: hypothetical protein VLA99_04425 [Nitrospiraceae bacterium]|nr:hypothetical protein [Nitrospiraceae bacterium]